MPFSEVDFGPNTFKIVRHIASSANPDAYLPVAHTCFFQVSPCLVDPSINLTTHFHSCIARIAQLFQRYYSQEAVEIRNVQLYFHRRRRANNSTRS